MLLNLIKVISVIAGGTTAIGAPILLRRNFSEKNSLLESIWIGGGKSDCKVLINSKSEQKKIVVCGKTTNIEFLFLKNDENSRSLNSQKVVSFQGSDHDTGEFYTLKFTIEGSSSETINVAKKGSKIKLLKDVELSKCSIVSSAGRAFNEIKCPSSVYNGSQQHLSIDLITYY